MRRLIVTILVVAVLSMTAWATTSESPTDGGIPISQVAVVNFPEHQLVRGAVNVTNLPPVQEVTGEVAVTNLSDVCVGQDYTVLQIPAFLGEESVCGGVPCWTWRSEPFDVAGWNQLTAQALDIGRDEFFPVSDVFYRNFTTEPFGIVVGYSEIQVPVFGTEAQLQTVFLNDSATINYFSVFLR